MNFNNWKETTLVDKSVQQLLKLEQNQELICQFFRELITTESTYRVLQKFDQIFIDYKPREISDSVNQALQYIIKYNAEAVFLATIKQCCYILVYPLIKAKKYADLSNLIHLFHEFAPESDSKITFIKSGDLIDNKIRFWVNKFSQTSSYQELKLLTYHTESDSFTHWTHRYLEYLFFIQYFNNDNCQEQRDLAIIIILRIQKEFKFNLAMYLTKSQFGNKNLTNPTILNENILRFIKLIAVRKGNLNYKNLAHLFLQQTKDLSYFKFHLSFVKYLVFSLYDKKSLEIIETKLATKLQELYQGNNEKKFNQAFLLRTCNKSFDLLLTNNGKPSDLFVLLMTQSNPYTLVILLLKIILISPNSQNHLDKKISELVGYYQNYPETECKWFISFLEAFRITFAIYADENVQYNLVKIKETPTDSTLSSNLDCYQFFFKSKKKPK